MPFVNNCLKCLTYLRLKKFTHISQQKHFQSYNLLFIVNYDFHGRGQCNDMMISCQLMILYYTARMLLECWMTVKETKHLNVHLGFLFSNLLLLLLFTFFHSCSFVTN